MISGIFSRCLSKISDRDPCLNEIHGELKRRCNLEKGVCFGMASLYAKAVLNGSESYFLTNLLNVQNCPSTVIDELKTFQAPTQCGHNFLQILKISQPAAADTLVALVDTNHVFTVATLEKFLSELHPHLPSSHSVFLLKSTTHAIALKPTGPETWDYFNPSSQTSDRPEKFWSARALAASMYNALRGNYVDRVNQVAINISIITNRAAHIPCPPLTKHLSNILSQLKAPNGLNRRAIDDLCNLAIESNDNATLFQTLKKYRLGPQAVATLKHAVDICGFYPNAPPSKSDIVKACLGAPNVPLDEVAQSLDCSVIELLPYYPEIQSLRILQQGQNERQVSRNSHWA